MKPLLSAFKYDSSSSVKSASHDFFINTFPFSILSVSHQIATILFKKNSFVLLTCGLNTTTSHLSGFHILYESLSTIINSLS